MCHISEQFRTSNIAALWLKAVVFAGWTGVDLFFVLSGFLITGILWDAKGSSGYFRNFYARRTVRIFPLYYATLVILFVLVPALSSGDAPGGRMFQELMQARPHWLWYGTYLVDVLVAWKGFLFAGHFWSLAVEEHFYLVWPVLVHRLFRRTLLSVSLALIVAPLILRAVMVVCKAAPTRDLRPDSLPHGWAGVRRRDGSYFARSQRIANHGQIRPPCLAFVGDRVAYSHVVARWLDPVRLHRANRWVSGHRSFLRLAAGVYARFAPACGSDVATAASSAGESKLRRVCLSRIRRLPGCAILRIGCGFPSVDRVFIGGTGHRYACGSRPAFLLVRRGCLRHPRPWSFGWSSLGFGVRPGASVPSAEAILSVRESGGERITSSMRDAQCPICGQITNLELQLRFGAKMLLPLCADLRHC